MYLGLLDNSYLFIHYLVLTLFAVSKAEWNTKDYMKREHSLIKPYQDASFRCLGLAFRYCGDGGYCEGKLRSLPWAPATGTSIPYWDILGNTIVTTNYVRLTPNAQSKSGAVWNIVPCKVRNWELQVHFKVHGTGKDLFGDGLAIWYAKARMVPGPVFGSMDFFEGLGIILDTYSNHNGPHTHQHPYISGMVNNGTLHYDHDRDGTHTQLAGCEAKFRNLDHDTHIAIRYEKDKLTVSTDFENKAAWKVCFTSEGIILPTGYYFGISAATGDLTDNHDVISIRLFELDLPDDGKETVDRSNVVPSAVFFEPPRERSEDPKPSSWSGVKLFLLMMLGSITLIVAVVLGIMYYQKQQENSRKRFY